MPFLLFSPLPRPTYSRCIIMDLNYFLFIKNSYNNNNDLYNTEPLTVFLTPRQTQCGEVVHFALQKNSRRPLQTSAERQIRAGFRTNRALTQQTPTVPRIGQRCRWTSTWRISPKNATFGDGPSTHWSPQCRRSSKWPVSASRIFPIPITIYQLPF